MAIPTHHVVFFPYPIPGHYLPMSTFAHSLAYRFSLRVTLILTEANLQKWQQRKKLLQSSRGEEVDKVHVVVVSDGLPLDCDRFDSQAISFFHTIQQMGPAVQKCLEELQISFPISCLISEPVFPWMQDVADHFALPLFLFATDSAAAVCALLHTQRLLSDGLIGAGSAGKADVLVDDIPGMPALPARFLPFPPHELELFFNLRVKMASMFQSAAGLLLNTCVELENEAVAFISRFLSKPVLAVGPCVPDFMLHGSEQGRKAGAEEEEEVMQWLDAQEPASVMYVSFGSLAAAQNTCIEEVWEGLRASKQPFLWATGSVAARKLAGEGMAKGRVVEWAAQQQVLSHAAIGGFMTHCGWNGVLEGVTAGVAMLCCPVFLDQPVGSALIVREWRMGLQLPMPLERAAVAHHVRLMLVGEEGKALRQRACQMRTAAMAALSSSPPLGSSTQSVHSLIKLLSSPPHRP